MRELVGLEASCDGVCSFWGFFAFLNLDTMGRDSSKRKSEAVPFGFVISWYSPKDYRVLWVTTGLRRLSLCYTRLW